MITLQFFFLFGLILFLSRANGSSSIEEEVKVPGFMNYEGRFSKIEQFSDFETLDAQESMIKCKKRLEISICLRLFSDNYTISVGGQSFICDLLCKVKAASSPVVVPSTDVKIAPYEPFWLKRKLLKDFNEVPIETFISNSIVFTATIEMIEYNLFYRIEEYNRFLAEVIENYSSGIEIHSIVENAWIPILKPIHLILEKLVRSSKCFARMESSFITKLVQLISSPIEEESEMTASLIKYILLNYGMRDSIISAINWNLDRGIHGEMPIIYIDPILRFVGDLLINLRNDRDSLLALNLIGSMKTRIIPLYSHSKLHLFTDAYTSVLLQYFSFFEMFSSMSIMRTPFDPMFPQESPFQESETVVLTRHALLREKSEGPNPVTNRLNQLSRYEVMNNLVRHQFYPRYMIPNVLEVIMSDFVKYTCVNSGVNLFSLLAKPEIYSGDDEVSSIVRARLPNLKDTLKKCEKMSREIRTICHRISEQLEIINYTCSYALLENVTE